MQMNRLNMINVSSVNGLLLIILLLIDATKCQLDGWKPIVGSSSYTRLTQHTPTINIENGDSSGENSVTFHNAQLIGSAGGGASDSILNVGDGGTVIDTSDTEGRFLGDTSSDYGSGKVFNSLYTTGGVS